MKRIIDDIKTFQEELKDRSIIEKLQVMIDFIIFNFQTTKSESTILKKFPVTSLHFIKLLLLKLKLFIKYEGKFLMLSSDCFGLLKALFLNFLSSIPQAKYEDDEVTEILCLLLAVLSKIYLIKEEIFGHEKKTEFEISLIQNSLLSNIRETIIVSTSNFWKGYFDYKFKRRTNHEYSTKMKVISIAESMIFYHFFLSLDMDLSTVFIENCLQVFNINLRQLKNTVMLRVGQVLYTLTEFYNKKVSLKEVPQTAGQKVCFVLGLVVRSGYCDRKASNNILCLNHKIKNEVSQKVIEFKLRQKGVEKDKRKILWLKYADVSQDSEFKFSNESHKKLPNSMIEQIDIDIVRTKLWKGEAYQTRIRDFMISFLESVDANFEYFQGFNYITSFFAEVFEVKADFSKFMNYISSAIFSVS
jgi:hypothetical protein